ncbi:WXG100 family type VII secretion target [uncultured Demequina sp.]|uniref:WXG100 family type VII secretion target n=1 Tax=uncultured Demequina sp. TaxID=693499 RepID=UPI0025E66D70|nr:WXG100 family type VII secretion target [uncultured Demequina sp.]
MTRYHVDAAEVASAAALAARSGHSIRGEVTAMMAHLTALDATWQGGAATAFAGVLDQWRVAQAQVEQALDALSGALAGAAEEYQSAEDAARSMFTPR